MTPEVQQAAQNLWLTFSVNHRLQPDPQMPGFAMAGNVREGKWESERRSHSWMAKDRLMQTLGEQLSELRKSDCGSRNDPGGGPEHCCRAMQPACPCQQEDGD